MSEIVFLLTVHIRVSHPFWLSDVTFFSLILPVQKKLFLTLSSKVSTKRTWKIENIYTAVSDNV